MHELKLMDKVAYIRFASVYKNFREIRDFENFVENISEPLKGDENL